MAKYTSEIFVTVDAVVFGFNAVKEAFVLLVQRKNEPFKGQWALPGGFVDKGEDLDVAVKRELEEETGVIISQVEQLGTFGNPNRDPRGRMVSVAYMAEVNMADVELQAADDASDAQWFPLDELPELAFDHEHIIKLALTRNLKLATRDLHFTQIKETCLYVTDLKRTRAFYEGKLGLECFSEVEGRHIFFRAGTSVLLCFIAEATKVDTSLPPHYGYGQQHFAFECRKEDYDAWRQKMLDVGIPIIQDVEWPRGGRSFYFHDPDMNVAEIVEEGIWEW